MAKKKPKVKNLELSCCSQKHVPEMPIMTEHQLAQLPPNAKTIQVGYCQVCGKGIRMPREEFDRRMGVK